ncbi:TorF family putative porin [Altererythrobacter sp. CAU 1778]
MLTSIRGLAASILATGVAFAATPVLAQDAESGVSVSGNVAVVTDYRFRGVSLSAGDPAIQGGIDVTTDSGFYVGTWGSSIDGGPLYGEMELDIYAGWSGEVSSGVTVDVGVLYYAYPANDFGPAEYYEPYASVSGSLGPASATLGVAYAPDQESLGDDDNLYIYTDFEMGVPETPISVTAHLGYTDGALSPDLLAGGTDGNGFDYSVGASATVLGGLSLGVAYVGVDGASVDGLTDDAVVGTLSYSF